MTKQTIMHFNFETVLLNEETLSWLENFNCGNPEIDRYVKEEAYKDRICGKGVTFLVIDKSREALVGYYTLCSTSLIYVEDDDIVGKENFNEIVISGIPSIEIKMFAISTSYQDTYCQHEDGDKLISDMILGSLIATIYEIAVESVGAEMIILHSVPDAIEFYKRNFFEPLDEYISFHDDYTKECTPMYMRLF